MVPIAGRPVVAETGIYACTGNDGNPGKLLRFAHDGGKTETLASGIAGCYQVALDAKAVYFITYSGGEVIKLAK